MYQSAAVYEYVWKRQRERLTDSTGPKIPKPHALMTTERKKGRKVVTTTKKKSSSSTRSVSCLSCVWMCVACYPVCLPIIYAMHDLTG